MSAVLSCLYAGDPIFLFNDRKCAGVNVTNEFI